MHTVILIIYITISLIGIYLTVSYYKNLIIQEEIEGQLHTIAYVNMDVVYETWMKYDNSDSVMLQYAILTQEKENAERAQEQFKERKKYASN